MATLSLPAPVAQIFHEPNGLKMIIPSEKSAFGIPFLICWICGWAFGEFSASKEISAQKQGVPNLFLLAWLGGWTIGGVFAMWSLLWMIAGREVLWIANGVLSFRREILGLGRTREFPLAQTRDFRISIVSTQSRRNLIPDGKIAFDYGSKTFRFGQSIDEAEAKDILEMLQSRYYSIPTVRPDESFHRSW